MKLNILKSIFSVISIVVLLFSLSACDGGACEHCLSYSPQVIMDSNDGGIANNATNTSLTPNMVLKFNQTLSIGEVNQQSIFLSTKSFIGESQIPSSHLVAISQIVANQNNNVFSFHPLSHLSPNTKYYVTVSGNIGSNNDIIYFPVNVEFTFTTGSSQFPGVNILSPENGTTNISILSGIFVQFSNNVQNVTNNNVILSKDSLNGEAVPIASIIANSDNTYNIVPKSPLDPLTTYYISFNNGITDLTGNILPTTSFSFTTGNNLKPSVNLLYPSNNSINVSSTPNIQLQFSASVENVNSSNIILATDPNGNNIIPISNITAGDNNTYTFAPTNPLAENTIYYVVIKNKITTQNGQNVDNSVFYFTTGSDTTPTASMISPTNNAVNVNNLPNIQIQFSLPVQNVNTTNVLMYQSVVGGSLIPISIQTESNNIYIITPTTSLGSGTTFYLTLSSGISDIDGISLSPTIFYFTTITNKTIFMTNSAYVGDLKSAGGESSSSGSADVLCGRDSAKPSASTNYKAMILTLNRSPSNLNNWVLQANTNYYNIESQLIGTTTSSAVFNFPIESAVTNNNVNVWTGAGNGTPWELDSGGALFYCNNWTDATGSVIGDVGTSNSLTLTLMTNNLLNRCNQPAHLYCVEQ